MIKSDIFQLKLATDVRPKLSLDLSKGIVKYGKNNDHEEQILFWYHNSAMHGAIVDGKASYLAGTKIEADQDTAQVKEFLDKPNPFEDWYSIRKKCEKDKALFGGYYLQIISNAVGMPVQYFHLDWGKCRVGDDFKHIKYSEDWGREHYKYGSVSFPLWKEGLVNTSVFVYKRYSPSTSKLKGAYPVPEYEPCTLDIDTDCRFTTYSNNYVKNGFSAPNLITIFNGETDQAKKEAIANNIKGNHTGEDNAGNSVVVFTNKDGKGTEITALSSGDIADQHAGIIKNAKQNILSGHKVNGVLFKIKDDGSKLGRSEIVQEHELFINEYAKVEQVPFNKMLSKFFKLRYFQDVNFDVEQVKPIGLELPLDNQNVIDTLNAKNPQILLNYILDKYGLEVPEETDAAGNVIETTQVNDNLKGLSAAENAGMLRIVRDFQRKRNGMTEALAIARITSYGVTEAEARKYLGLPVQVQQSAQDKQSKFIALFHKYAHDINFEDEVLEVQNVKFLNTKTPLDATASQLRNSILNELKGNPGISNSKLANKYQVNEAQVREVLDFLIEKELVKPGTNGLEATEKALKKNTDPIETEIYTEYVYGLRDDQAGQPLLLATSRDWCVQMVNLTKYKALTYEAIKALENEFGDSAWDFRGGPYHNPKTDETTNHCRHAFKAFTKIRRKKNG